MAAVRNNQTAKGAIDMAVHDVLAQSEGQTLAERLGASWDAVRVSYILGIGARDRILAEAERCGGAGGAGLEGRSRSRLGRGCGADP
jgi:L-alanine-DL-glutamate epimerase-like enolase superfamily enzyme